MVTSLYERVLGQSWHHLSPVLKKFHGGMDAKSIGYLHVMRSRSIFVRCILSILSLPKSGYQQKCEVQHIDRVVDQKTNMEYQVTYLRMIGQQRFKSVFQITDEKHRLSEHLFEEKFGCIKIVLKNVVKPSKHGFALWQYSVLTKIFGLQLPKCLSLKIVAVEYPTTEHQFKCKIYIGLPFFGKLLSYGGIFNVVGA